MAWRLAPLFLLCSCAAAPSPVAPIALARPSSEPHAATPAAAPAVEPTAATCGTEPREIGRVDDVQLNEISGVAESRRDPRVLFVHNDSGDSPRFFAIDRAGRVLAELVLESVPLLIDAEELTIGRGPGGAQFIYLGDTGNNFASQGVGIPRRKAVLYRIAEPDIPKDAHGGKLLVRDAFPIVLTFPQGAQDIEAFFIDPASGDLFLIGKRPDGHSQILSASAAQLEGGGGELRLLGELQFGKEPLKGNPMPTAASISRDGSKILVRTYDSVWLFSRSPGEPVLAALQRAPRSLPAPQEKQGEAIGFVDDDQAFVTLSEGLKPAVNCVAIPP